MDAYLVFSPDNSHTFRWLLNRERRHVWCILADHKAGVWVSYNWDQGLPIVRVESSLDFDIAAHYTQQGLTVVSLDHIDRSAVSGPVVLNNCVGHVKSVLGIPGFSMVPNQLFKYIRRAKVLARARSQVSAVTVPGFGSNNKTPAPPTHYSDGTPIGGVPGRGPPSEMAIRADATLAEQERQRKLASAARTTASSTLLNDDGTKDIGNLT